MFGLVNMRAVDDQTRGEIGAFGTTGAEQVGIYEGTCEALASTPTFTLNPVDPETLTSDTTVDASFADLTAGAYAVAIRARDSAGTILACNEIPQS